MRDRIRLDAVVRADARETPARDGGCRVKPSRQSRGMLAEAHARAAMRDDLATDELRVTDEMAAFGTHP
jgi:hypothetical protein